MCCPSTRPTWARRRLSLLQHRRQLRHQHQLAELRRREHACPISTQMAGLTHQNFVSAATGIALAMALIRGFARASAQHGRQFLGRSDPRHALYAAADLASSITLVLVWQGMPQTLRRLCRGHDAGRRAADHRGRPGRLADCHQDARHQWRRLLQRQRRASVREPDGALEPHRRWCRSSRIGAALTNVFGRMVGNQRQGWAILAAMGVLFVAGVAVCLLGRSRRQPRWQALGVDGGNMEGKEVRFGIVASALFAVVTTAASCSAVNAMHDSFTALGGMIPLINMQLGEIIVGGVGAGLLRHAAVRRRRGLRGRADGRPHAGISRQEDRGERGEDGRCSPF